MFKLNLHVKKSPKGLSGLGDPLLNRDISAAPGPEQPITIERFKNPWISHQVMNHSNFTIAGPYARLPLQLHGFHLT